MAYREAARECGLSSHQDLHRAARRIGLLEVHGAQLVAGSKRIYNLSNQELERRLVDDPEGVATKGLAIIGSIHADKVAKFESWEQVNQRRAFARR